MLYPAQLYENELREKLMSCWYQPEYDWYFGGEYNSLKLTDSHTHQRDFVHISTNGKVDGYFSYMYSGTDRAMTAFSLIGFSKNNSLFIRDILNHITEMFKSNAQKLEFYAFSENPVNNLYEKTIKRYGGRKVGVLRRHRYFNGKCHDCNIYEILNEDWHYKR